MAVERGRRGNHDYDSAFLIFADGLDLGQMRETLSDEVDGASQIDIHDEVEVI